MDRSSGAFLLRSEQGSGSHPSRSNELPESKAAETGIFKVQNQSMKGFQQGIAEGRENGVIVDLYSDEGALELMISQKKLQRLRRGYTA